MGALMKLIYWTVLISFLSFNFSCSKMEKKERDREAASVEGEFTSEEVNEPITEKEFVDLSDFNKNKFGYYKVKKADSLLLISFRVYRDYQKWWVFKHFNQGLDENVLIPGTTLKYPLPKKKLAWHPKGNPYLILNGDSLTGISLKKYRDAMKWTKIWENNKPLIKNPDHIFAGFTIFYEPDPKVIELASLSQMGKIPVYKRDLAKKKEVKKAEPVKVEVAEEPKQNEVSEEQFESSKVADFEEEESRKPSSENKKGLSAGVVSDELVPSESSK
jgi:hypothetical protein